MKYRCQRQVSKCGGSSYVPMPRQAFLDLRLFLGDWVEVTLDTETHVVTISALQRRAVAPLPGPKQNVRDMVPEVIGDPPAPRPRSREQPQLVEAGS